MRAVLLLALTILGCAAADNADPAAADAAATTGGTVEMRIIATGGYAAAQPETPRSFAVKTAADYPRVWEQTIGGGAPPEVDFAKESVVILLGGSKPTGGYSVVPRGVSLEGRTLVVDAQVKGPPPDAIVTQAFTSPYAVIAVSTKSFDDVRWTP